MPTEFVLATKVLPGEGETAASIREYLATELIDWGLKSIPLGNRLYITLDRGTNVQAALNHPQVQEDLKAIPCFSHVLQRAIVTAMRVE